MSIINNYELQRKKSMPVVRFEPATARFEFQRYNLDFLKQMLLVEVHAFQQRIYSSFINTDINCLNV